MVYGERGNKGMAAFYDGLRNNQIYNNKDLTNFFLSLEKRYNVISNVETYNQLVNFSQNKDIPIHEWFKYREGFSGKLVDRLIQDAVLEVNDIIVDPFVGSGTTLVSSVSLGFDAVGIDVNPVSTVLSKVKSTKYSDKDIKSVLSELNKLLIQKEHIKITVDEDIAKYFSLNNYTDLKKISKFLCGVKDQKAYEILFCAYLSIIEPCSNRKRDGNGLRTVASKVTNVLAFFNDKVHQILKDISNISTKFNAVSYVFTGSANNIYSFCNLVRQQANKSIGCIIFSPPYANSFDYFESYKLELFLGGFIDDNNNINTYRSSAIRSFIGGAKELHSDKYVELLAQEIADAIPVKEAATKKKDARTRKVPQMIMGYFKDMADVIEECYKSLKDNGRCYIVIDQSAYLGKIVPSDLLFAYFAEKHGFVVDKIIECRTAKTSVQQTRQFPYLKTMLRESIVVLAKPN